MAAYAATVGPQGALSVPDPAELEEMRASALDQLRLTMARALPTAVAPDVLAGAFARSVN